ncbi:MAG: Crp/Fnr family transcriptional regulator [Lachnospiraceae bacterium]|nr:Crp/Fnr family transcriptional regulator [Lachnospiraceae bacterium]
MEEERIRQILRNSVFPLEKPTADWAVRIVGCHQGQIVNDSPKGGPSVGIIVSGRVDVYSVAVDGRDIQLNSLEKGDCFGICNIMEGSQLETVLRCGEKTEILYIAKKAVMTELERNPILLEQYIRLCNRKIQFLLHRIGLLTMQSCRGKLLAFLLEEQALGGEIKVKGSREDLARMLGVSRAALFRELSLLQRQKVIRVTGNRIRILDGKKLEAMLYQPMGA